ncbi:hypothetical protein N0V90_012129 [Kalmusia sp. IMI 367209]|nr:hypothetical protein N0V90_012129 [Kalmusia sp. IMI 367209]
MAEQGGRENGRADDLQAMSFVCNIPFVLRSAHGGMGRLKADPFFTPDRILTFNHLQFISICLQMYAMFLVKLSVCCYLLPLNFSRKFRIIMWIVTLIVVTFNLVMPALLHFAYCRPYYYRWNPSIKPDCWNHTVGSTAEYAQVFSNIATDLVYASAPLVYLSQANLTKQLRWKVRVMFLLALV